MNPLLNPLMVQSLRLYHFYCPNELIWISSGRDNYLVIIQPSHKANYEFSIYRIFVIIHEVRQKFIVQTS